MVERALLVLDDGTCYAGQALGAVGQAVSELVLFAGMTGYQEALTDPANQGKIMVMTAPHVGNTGVNDMDSLSPRATVAGLVARAPARLWSNFRGQRSLQDELVDSGVVGIGQIDTRAITLHLREFGPTRAGIFSGPALLDPQGRELSEETLLEMVGK